MLRMLVLMLSVSTVAAFSAATVKRPRSMCTQRRATLQAEEYAETPEDIAKSLIANIFEGDFGTRGEGWVFGQAAIIASLLVAPDLPAFSPMSRIVGLLVILAGLAVATVGAADLGSSLSIWPKPVSANALRTDGVYSLCRHPMYTGFILGGGGFGLLTASSERLLLALALYAMLSAKASREEEFLREKHGAAYAEWEASVPRFFPRVEALRDLTAELKARG